MKIVLFSLILVSALILSACSPAPVIQPPVNPVIEATPAGIKAVSDGKLLTDQQGSVVVEATPLDLDQPGQMLDFQISMNTHTVDLSMDLTTLATLTTDTGYSVQASSWDGARGGHHVSGKLSFPGTTNGKPLLQGASRLTLTIKNVDATARLFTWNISN